MSSSWSRTKDIDTFIPLSNSPEPVKVNWFPIVQDFPEADFDVFLRPILAPPATDISPATAEETTSEPASAVNPSFLKLFILITPYI